MKKIAVLVLTAILVGASLVACGTESDITSQGSTSGNVTNDSSTDQVQEDVDNNAVEITDGGSVTASGSSALLPLVQLAAENFMDANMEASIIVNGGGSGTGLQQVSDGVVDIGNSDVFAEEKLDTDTAAELVDYKVCTVTMAAVVNKDLGVVDLTAEQIKGIFTGEITNWNEVGGPDLEILLVTRPTSSGTRALFKTYALDGAEEAANASLETDDSGTLLETVQNNVGAIGYVSLSYLANNEVVIPVAIDGIEATLENTYKGTYTVWGYGHMYTKGEAIGTTKLFLDYIMSDSFAENIEAMGYGAASKLSQEAIATH